MKFTIKSRKTVAFIVLLIILCGAFTLTTLFASDQVGATWPWFVGGIVFSGALYIGGNVWKDFIKSKYFKAELADDT